MPSSDDQKLELIVLPRQEVDDLWPLILPFVLKAIPRSCGRLTPENLREGAMAGQYQLLLIGAAGEGMRAVAAAQILGFPEKTVLSVFMYSGERRRAMHLWPLIDQMARDLGCKEVQISGPRAWGRIFPDFTEAYTVYTKEV